MKPLSPITLSIIAAASSVYPDGLVAEVLNPITGALYPMQPGDTLAQFVALEIEKATRGEGSEQYAAALAADAIERAAAQLTKVANELRDREADAACKAADEAFAAEDRAK